MRTAISIVISIIGAAAAAIAVLWGTEVIPKGIGRHTATEYVQENYVEMGLEFENDEFSTAYGDYIASFAGEDGTVYNYFSRGGVPFSVVYDSIKRSVV